MAHSHRRLVFRLLVLLFSIMGSTVWGELSYAGSSSIGDHMLPELIKVFKEKTGYSFGEVNPTDSEDGFILVKEGKVLLGGLSRFLTQEELASDLANRVLAYDAVVVYVERNNPVKSLSMSQVKGIFSGTITNWKNVGGIDGRILVVLKKKIEGGTYGQFQELALGGAPFCEPGLAFDSHKENIDYVASNPLGISLGSLAFDEKVSRILAIDDVYPSIETLNQGVYPLARPYVLVFREDPDNKEMQAFLDFVFSAEGQKIVRKYAVPVLEFGE